MGDRVRIAMQKRPFRKGYLGDWSHEILEIKSRLPTVPITYELVDLAGESIRGRFYNQELQSRRRTLRYRSHTQDEEA